MFHDITLNIHYTIPDSLFNRLVPLLEELETYDIVYSIEPGGLQLYEDSEENQISDKQWKRLIERFCKQASEILGFAIGDACDDFPCIPFQKKD